MELCGAVLGDYGFGSRSKTVSTRPSPNIRIRPATDGRDLPKPRPLHATNDFGPPLVAVGIALLLVPIAEAMGALGYVLLGLGFVTVGGMVAFLPDSAGVAGDAGGTRANANHCPDCGSPNDADAETCESCGATL